MRNTSLERRKKLTACSLFVCLSQYRTRYILCDRADAASDFAVCEAEDL